MLMKPSQHTETYVDRVDSGPVIYLSTLVSVPNVYARMTQTCSGWWHTLTPVHALNSPFPPVRLRVQLAHGAVCAAMSTP